MAYRSNETVIAQLHQCIDSLDRSAARTGGTAIAHQLDVIRRMAAANGVTAALPIVHAIESALGRGERGPAIYDGLALLRDAACCGDDARSGAVLAAAYSRRFAG